MFEEESPLSENIEESSEESQIAEELVEADFRLLQEQIQSLSNERDQFQAQLMRTMADFQNFRKRSEADNAQRALFATERFATNLLPVLDNFERTIRHAEAGATREGLLDGIRAVERQLRQVLEGQNVRRIESVGQPFDPEFHEAIGFESSTEHEPNSVVIEVEPGYKMGEKVVRPARVKVAGG
jgi:molecular chaperone GrpE